MRRMLWVSWLMLAWPLAATAVECQSWQRMDDDQKTATVQQMIDGHLDSDRGRSFTSENKVAMRRCLEAFRGQIVAEFDGACAEGLSASLDVLDQTFDRYFLSCVQ